MTQAPRAGRVARSNRAKIDGDEHLLSEADTNQAEASVVHVVEDDEAVRDALMLMLGARGFRVHAHASAGAFLDGLPKAERGCIVTDVMMPQMTGLELLKRLRALGVDWHAVVISGRATRQMAIEAATLAATALLDKPFEPDELVALIGQATARAG